MADRCALIIANDAYEHRDLASLQSPARDAHALQQVLGDPRIGGYQVQVVRNQPHHQVMAAIGDFLDGRARDDLLLVHFSGHGLKDEFGELYLAGTNSVPARLSTSAVPAQFLNREMARSRAGAVVLFLDCCFGGAFGRGMVPRSGRAVDLRDSFPLHGLDQGRGRVIISASSATEYAFEGDRLAAAGQPVPSVFTAALVHGLASGEADTGHDGLVDLHELYDFVYDRVRGATRHQQTPSRSEINLQGRLIVAATPVATRIEPGELPAGLADRAARGDVPAKLSVAGELRRVLLDDDVPRAAAAMNVLRTLARDDSTAVREVATAALAEALPKVLPHRVEFDRPDPVGGPATRTVELVGPPLARTFQATTAAPWLRVGQDGTRIRLTVDPAAAPPGRGELQATVEVASVIGPAGPVEVSVRRGGRPGARPAGAPGPGRPAADRLGDTALLDSPWAPLAAAAAAAVANLTANLGQFGSGTLVGFGFLVLHLAPMFVAVWLLAPRGPAPANRHAIGLGLAFGASVYAWVDALELIHSGVYAGHGWGELLAVAAYDAVLAVRLRPLWPGRPAALWRRFSTELAAAWPPRRPLVHIAAVAVVAQLVLVLGVPVTSLGVTLVGGWGVAPLLAVLVMGAFCVLAILLEPGGQAHRLFASSGAIAYFGPEIYFLLAAPLAGGDLRYLGADSWSGTGASAFALVVQLATTVALLGAALLSLHGGGSITLRRDGRDGRRPGRRPGRPA